jgi:hypothetical protein
MLAGFNAALDRPVILFKDIVEILHRSMSAILLQRISGFELHDGRVSGVVVGVDDLRMRMVPSQGFGQKALGGHGVVLGPVTSTRDLSLVGFSRERKRRLSSGSVTLHPSLNRDVIGEQATPGQFLDVVIRQ